MRNLSLFLMGAMSIVAIGCSNGGDQVEPSDAPREGITSDVATDCHKFEDLLPEAANGFTHRFSLDARDVRITLMNGEDAPMNLSFPQTEEQILEVEKVEEGQELIDAGVRIGPNNASNNSYKAYLLEKDIRGLYYESADGASLADTAEKFKLVFQIDTIPADAETEVESCTVIVDTYLHNPTIATEEDNSEEAAPTEEEENQ